VSESESDLDRWLRRQAAREQRVVLLEEGLLGNRLWRYSWYRLRYFFVRYAFESATHAVTVIFLFRGVAWGNFLLIVVATSLTGLASSFWWGALEALRSRVRDLHRSGKPHLIPRVIGGWLAFACVLSALVLAIAIGFVAWRASDGRLEAADAFVAVLLVRLALDLPVRCYHSGVYALRRVYKPLAASLAPEILALIAIAALWPLAGVWGLVAATLLSTTATTALTLTYTRRVYHFLGFTPLRYARLETLRAALRGAARESLLGGFSYTLMALDSLVVLALILGAKTDSKSLLVLFLAMPTIRAGFDWASLLYFDLKRLELRLFTNLRRRFERHTLALGWLLAVVFWAVAAAIATGYYGRSAGTLVAVLLGFFIARSLLARVQIQAFAEGAYAAVLGTGALCLGGLAAVGPLAEGETERLAAVGVVTAVAALVLSRLGRLARARGEPGTALLTLEWLGRLGRTRTPVWVGSARVTSSGGPERLDARTREDRNRWRLAQLAARTARRVGRVGAATWVGPDRLVWFEPRNDAPRITADWLQRASGGLIDEVTSTPCANGEEALLAAGRAGLVGYASDHLLEAILPVDVEEAGRSFQELVPGGVLYAPDGPVPPELATLSGRELRTILFEAVAFARDLRPRRSRSRFEVSALCAGGELRLIFVADSRAGRTARLRWLRQVTRLNVRAAIGGGRVGTHPARLGRLAVLRERAAATTAWRLNS
jgi:hypothetical protein